MALHFLVLPSLFGAQLLDGLALFLFTADRSAILTVVYLGESCLNDPSLKKGKFKHTNFFFSS